MFGSEYKPEHEQLMKEREKALGNFRAANISHMMKDLAVKEPWTGPGRDPTADKWDNEPAAENEDDEEDSGDDIDRSAYSSPVASSHDGGGSVFMTFVPRHLWRYRRRRQPFPWR